MDAILVLSSLEKLFDLKTRQMKNPLLKVVLQIKRFLKKKYHAPNKFTPWQYFLISGAFKIKGVNIKLEQNLLWILNFQPTNSIFSRL